MYSIPYLDIFIDVIRIILYNKYMYFNMSTYEEFMVILTAGILLVSILVLHTKINWTNNAE